MNEMERSFYCLTDINVFKGFDPEVQKVRKEHMIHKLIQDPEVHKFFQYSYEDIGSGYIKEKMSLGIHGIEVNEFKRITIEIEENGINIMFRDSCNRTIFGKYIKHSIFDLLGFRNWRINKAIVERLKERYKFKYEIYKVGGSC